MNPENNVEEVYEDRNLVVQLAAKLAIQCGYIVWWGVDPKEPDWPVLYIELPEGQLSWHLPKDDIALLISNHRRWDGHTTKEKLNRIKQFVSKEEN